MRRRKEWPTAIFAARKKLFMIVMSKNKGPFTQLSLSLCAIKDRAYFDDHL